MIFAKWKAKRAEREAAEKKIEQDSYLRRLRNSARTLTGTTHSGSGCEDALDPYEIRSILWWELQRLSVTEQKP